MPSLYALALPHLDGVGRVTAHRVMEYFPTLEALRETPREQVLVRLKGLPRAEDTVNALFDEGVVEKEIENAKAYVKETQEYRVSIVTPLDDGYPSGVARLDTSIRPTSLFLFGEASLLKTPAVALLAEPPVTQSALEAASKLATDLSRHAVTAMIGCSSGFDATLLQQAAGIRAPTVAIVPAGLSKLESSLRPAAAALTRSGGCLCSPFEMAHGPFDHDVKEAQRVQAALAKAVVAFESSPDSSSAEALAWAATNSIPVFRHGETAFDAETLRTAISE